MDSSIGGFHRGVRRRSSCQPEGWDATRCAALDYEHGLRDAGCVRSSAIIIAALQEENRALRLAVEFLRRRVVAGAKPRRISRTTETSF